MPSLFDADLTGLPQTTRSGFYYEVGALDYREQWVPAANRTTVTARVDALDAFDWVTDMVGSAYVSATTLRRHLPEVNPFDPNQWCTKVEQVDQGGLNEANSLADPVGSGWPFTKWCRYRCTFEAMPFNVVTDADADTLATTLSTSAELLRYCVRSQSTYAREQQIPGGGFKTIDDGTPANRLLLMQTGFKTRVYGDVTYTRVRVPVAHLPAELKSHRGKINSTVFDTAVSQGGYDFDPGELLYVGYDDNNRYWDANEDWVCDLVLNFKFCQGGWNFYYSKTGVLTEVSSDGTSGGTKPYTTADLHDLFTVD